MNKEIVKQNQEIRNTFVNFINEYYEGDYAIINTTS